MSGGEPKIIRTSLLQLKKSDLSLNWRKKRISIKNNLNDNLNDNLALKECIKNHHNKGKGKDKGKDKDKDKYCELLNLGVEIIEKSNQFYHFRDKFKIEIEIEKNNKIYRPPHLKQKLKKTEDRANLYNISPINLSVNYLQFLINTNSLTSNIDIKKDTYLRIIDNPIFFLEQEDGITGTFSRFGSITSFFNIFENDLIHHKTDEEYRNDYKQKKFVENIGILNYNDLKDSSNPLLDVNTNKQYKIAESHQYISYIYSTGNALIQDIDKFFEHKLMQNHRNPNHTTFKDCDLSVPDKYIIIDKSITLDDGYTYIICGYPEPKIMRPYLDLLNLDLLKDDKDQIFKKIYDDHKINFSKYNAMLYNSINENINKIDLENLEDEIYKFYGKSFHTDYILIFYKNYIIDTYKITNEEIEEYVKDYNKKKGKLKVNTPDNTPDNTSNVLEKYCIFINNFKKLRNDYFNKLGNKYLNTPMLQINYIFLIFKYKENKYTDLVPAIFNIRQLENKHIILLNKIKEFIENDIPKIFNISENKDPYKLFYSYYKLGDCFHIKTNYVHTLSNISNSAYKIEDTIQLDEIIYMLTTKTKFNFNYILKNFRILTEKKDNTYYIDVNTKIHNTINKCRHTTDALENKENIINIPLDIFINKSKILLLYKEMGNNYTIIYKSNEDKFNLIKIKTNLCNIENDIYDVILQKVNNSNPQYFNEIYSCSTNNEKYYTITNNNINVFKIIEHIELSSDNYRYYYRYIPVIIKNLSRIPKEDVININYFFQSNLLETTSESITIPNLYKFKPILIYNYLNSKLYKKGLELYNDYEKTNEHQNKLIYIKKETNNTDKLNSSIDFKVFRYCSKDNEIYKNISNFKSYTTEYKLNNDNKVIIKCVYYNVNDSGYNLVEIGKIDTVKPVVYIIPSNESNTELNITSSEYISNFMDLDGSNINHMKILYGIQKIYNDKICFVHRLSIFPLFSCIHFHIISKEYYKIKYPNIEVSLFRLQDLSLNKIINNLTSTPKYYNNYNTNLISVI